MMTGPALLLQSAVKTDEERRNTGPMRHTELLTASEVWFQHAPLEQYNNPRLAKRSALC
ncbi:hypothetical protein HXX25_10815 [Hyphobacterium sp. CCMP332]|uniref:hypothetical protein n=1 Tax=Hyphobacterium sp. CCMP332 TaxID=2749086 RepID=UPI00164FE0A3|nr:hypothetical protein [Hyphobacterium sp. CCMP332]QNL19773.1 hypothetical protein HXX25_10815 [Hyphobacterium sp. CCMP332]